jgi:trimeric autotransporter adhesin
VTSASAWFLSDKRFKENIKPLNNTLEKLQKLNGYNYTFKTEEFKDKNFNSGRQIGFIAQEIKEVFPELVMDTRDGYLAVNYTQMTPVLVEAIKEQQAQIEELKAMIKTLMGNPDVNKSVGMQAISLSDKNSIVLNQNVPNPFAESTVITYNIPAAFSRAQILFSTNGGVVIKTVDITAEGPGSLTVFANDLSNGMYTYSLVVDGKIMDSKKMIKQ